LGERTNLTEFDVNIIERAAGPPTYQDFVTFFKARQRTTNLGKLVFWSGVGIAESQRFAKANGCQILEMILGNNWQQFQGVQPQGYWPNWPTAIANFWDLASQACAEYATGEAFSYAPREVAKDQTRPTCPKCWSTQQYRS
jgi:hypothetical protein